MNRYIDKEIESVFSNIFHLGSLTEKALSDSAWALAKRGEARELARSVIDGDDKIDDLASEINRASFGLIARHQPVALDLRALEAAIRIALDLERIADLAVNIARIASLPGADAHSPEKLKSMSEFALKMLAGAMSALGKKDASAAEKIFAMDDELDDMENEVFSGLMDAVIESNSLTRGTYDLITVARLLERAGDHVTNICEQVCYMASGRRVAASDYRRPKAETL